MGKGKVLGALLIICLIGFGVYYAIGPISVYSRELELSGVGYVIDTFEVYGFRNELQLKVIIEASGLFNITILDASDSLVYTHQDIYGGDTYYINATISISTTGKYKIIYMYGGVFHLKIEIKGYHTILKSIPL